MGNIRDVYLFGELKVYVTFFDELCLLMTNRRKSKVKM